MPPHLWFRFPAPFPAALRGFSYFQGLNYPFFCLGSSQWYFSVSRSLFPPFSAGFFGGLWPPFALQDSYLLLPSSVYNNFIFWITFSGSLPPFFAPHPVQPPIWRSLGLVGLRFAACWLLAYLRPRVALRKCRLQCGFPYQWQTGAPAEHWDRFDLPLSLGL